eukprot:2511984-Prymnesium_polylepis.1
MGSTRACGARTRDLATPTAPRGHVSYATDSFTRSAQRYARSRIPGACRAHASRITPTTPDPVARRGPCRPNAGDKYHPPTRRQPESNLPPRARREQAQCSKRRVP